VKPVHRSAVESLQAAKREIEAELKGLKTRARAPLVRELHEITHRLKPGFPYASQAGQDVVIDRLFAGKTQGVFVDVGAYDGVTGSNSLFFEQRRGWTGVMVEPVAAQAAAARMARKAPCIECAVGPEEGRASFIEVTKGFTQMSGLETHYDSNLLDRVRSDPRHAENRIEIEVKTLSSILIETKTPHPDFVSLDIEGGEIAVLEAFPFADHDVGVWAIENNTGKSDLNRLMSSKGYALIEFCGPDEIYHKPK